MNENWQTLEHEIDVELTNWSARLAVPLPPRLLTQVQQRVELAANEQWLAEQAVNPMPRPRLMQNVRAAIATEVKLQAIRRRSIHLGRSLAACAAAVFVLVCFGLIRFSAQPNRAMQPVIADEQIEMIAAAAERALDLRDPYISDEITAVSQRMTEFERNISNWDRDGNSDNQKQLLDDLRQDIDDLLDNADSIPLSSSTSMLRILG